jgi:hypothetical protein
MSLRQTRFSIGIHFHFTSLRPVSLYLHSLSLYIVQTRVYLHQRARHITQKHVFIYLHLLSPYVTHTCFSICTYFHGTSLRHTGVFASITTARPTYNSVSLLLILRHVANRYVFLLLFNTLAHILLNI